MTDAPMVSHFLSDPAWLEVDRHREKYWYVRHHAVEFFSESLGREVVVPIGYHTDLASIPDFLKDRIDVNGKHREAAIVHDYLCTDGEFENVSQAQADIVFREAMEALRVGPKTRWAMYNAVKAFQKFKCWRAGESYE